MKKNIFKYIIMAVVSVNLLFACNDDNKEDSYPVINLTEVGHDNSFTAKQGDDLHLEAEITAENLIKVIDINIFASNNTNAVIHEFFTQGKYIGVKNTEFHEHIDIPSDIPLGKYRLQFSVTDMKGHNSVKEVEINITENDGLDNYEHEDKK